MLQKNQIIVKTVACSINFFMVAALLLIPASSNAKTITLRVASFSDGSH